MELHWSLIIFTFFMCASAGTFILQSLLTLKRRAIKMQNLSILVTLILLIIGGIGVFTHLQHWERIFNGFGHITSGITWELIFCILFGITIVLFFLFKQRSDDGIAPKWCCILGIIIPAALIVVMSDSYLMAARPVWNTFLLILYYLANAVLMGGLVVVFIAGATGEKDCIASSAKYSFVGGVAQLIVLVAYVIYMQIAGSSFSDVGNYFDPTLPDIAMTKASTEMASPLMGSCAPLFWIGVVIIGLIVPIAIMLRERGEGTSIADMFKVLSKSTPAAEAEGEAAVEATSEETGKTGLKGFFQIVTSSLSRKQKVAYALALVTVAAGGVCWRVVLYLTAISAFPIYSIS